MLNPIQLPPPHVLDLDLKQSLPHEVHEDQLPHLLLSKQLSPEQVLVRLFNPLHLESSHSLDLVVWQVAPHDVQELQVGLRGSHVQRRVALAVGAIGHLGPQPQRLHRHLVEDKPPAACPQ